MVVTMTVEDEYDLPGCDVYSAEEIFKTNYNLTYLDEHKPTIKRLTKELLSRFKYIDVNSRGNKVIGKYESLVYNYTGKMSSNKYGVWLLFPPFEWKVAKEQKGKEILLSHPEKYKLKQLDNPKPSSTSKSTKKAYKRKYPTYTEIKTNLNLPFDIIPTFHRLLIYSLNGCKIRKYKQLDEELLLKRLTGIRKLYKEVPHDMLMDLLDGINDQIAKEQGWSYYYNRAETYEGYEGKIISKIHDVLGAKQLYRAGNRCYRIHKTTNLEDNDKWWYNYNLSKDIDETYYSEFKCNTVRQFLRKSKAELLKNHKKEGKVILEKLGFKV